MSRMEGAEEDEAVSASSEENKREAMMSADVCITPLTTKFRWGDVDGVEGSENKRAMAL